MVASYLLFVLVSLSVLLNAAILAVIAMGWKVHSWIKFVIGWTIAAYSLVIGGNILLGAAGILFFPAVVTVHLVITIVLLVLFGKRLYFQRGEIFERDIYPKIDWLLIAALFTPLLMVVVTRFFNAVFQVPVEYDNLAYHLPFVVEWLTTGNLWEIYYSAYAGPLGYYPSNYGMVHLFTFLPFGNDVLINLVNIPVFLAFPFVMYGVMRNFLISHRAALVSIALFFMLPVTLRQIGTPLVDLFFCMSFLAAVYYLVEYWKTRKTGDLLLLGASLGMFMGTKYLGLIYAFPLICIALVLLVWKYRTRLKALWKPVILFSLIITLLGGFWYIRNFVDSGNPIFPTEVKLGDWTIFGGYKGITDNLLQTSLAQNIPDERSFGYFFSGFFQMVGAPLYVLQVGFGLFLMTLVFLLYYSFRGKDPLERRDARMQLIMYGLLLSSIVFYVIMYWISPYSFKDLIPNVRYAFMAILLAILALGIAVSRFKLLQPLFFVASILAILYNFVFLVLFPPLQLLTNEKVVLDFFQIQLFTPYFLGFIVLLMGALYVLYLFRMGREHRLHMPVAIILLCSMVGFGAVFLKDTAKMREELRPALYASWYAKNTEWLALFKIAEWLNQNDTYAPVAYTGFNMHYPLFGRNLERVVSYVNVNDCLDCRYVDYRNDAESIRVRANSTAWMNNLRAQGKKYIVLEDIENSSLEHAWIKENSDSFQLILEERFSFRNNAGGVFALYLIKS